MSGHDVGDSVTVVDSSNGKRLKGTVFHRHMSGRKYTVWIEKFSSYMTFVDGVTPLGRFQLVTSTQKEVP